MSMFHELMMKKKGIPSRYQEVEYIESDGPQYINTGLVPKATFKYKIKYSLNATGNQVLFGSRTSGAFDTSRNQIYFNANNNAEGGPKTYLLNIFNVNNVNLNIVPTQNVIVETPIMQNENCIIENATQPIYLFALNNRGAAVVFAKTKMYYYQIYDNSSLIRNFIPVYDTETQKYGMWESVQRKFYGNAGIGDFKGSIVGYTIVGSPTITDGVVSGFSTSSYLRLPQPTIGLADFEIATCFKANSIQSARLVSDVVSGSTVMGISIVNNSGIRAIFNGSIHTFIQSSVVYNTTDNYYVIMYRKGTTIGIKVSTDNINWTENTDTIQSTDELNFATQIELGVNRYGGGTFDGSLDLNYTYIKLDNKLYFNGQQA